MSENKAIDKANLELALSENNKRLLEHTDTANLELRQNLNVMSQYQKYLNTDLDYIQICFPGDTTVNNVNVGTIIPFSQLAFSNNLDFDSSTYTIKLNAGKTYKITSHIRTLNSSGYFYFNTYNKTQNKIVGLSGCVETPSSYNNNVVNTPIKTILNCNEDTEIQFKITAINAARTIIFTGLSTVIVEEINRQIVIDPIEHVNTEYGLEDAPVGHIISHMGTKAPSHYLICDGSEYNILDYPELANHILDNFGSYNYFGGDGELTFCVPDLRGEFLRGAGTAMRDTGSGTEVGEHQDATRVLNMTSGMYVDNNVEVVEVFIGLSGDGYNVTGPFDKSYKQSSYYSYLSKERNPGYHNNYYDSGTVRPTNTSVLYCIKYEHTYYTKVNNTNYLSASLYSEEERVIGCWINGKPLYEKTIVATTPSSININADIKDVSDLNIEHCTSINGFFIVINDIYTTNELLCSESERVWYRNWSKKIAMSTSREIATNETAYITLQYTKTTDAENSFTNDMIKDYIASPENHDPSYTDDEINTAIADSINLLNEV